ncbi:MAG: hypothetical protein QOG46_790 [Pseudonocardiales bacterium]|nr:hypothetical protein [Pseudonocardiales bacterium]
MICELLEELRPLMLQPSANLNLDWNVINVHHEVNRSIA